MHLYCTDRRDPTVLLEAGSRDWSLNLRPFQKSLAGATRVCKYDRAGYGWSEPGPAPRTGERIVDELEVLLDEAAEPGPYVLAGHSFGALTMPLFAQAIPRRSPAWCSSTPHTHARLRRSLQYRPWLPRRRRPWPTGRPSRCAPRPA